MTIPYQLLGPISTQLMPSLVKFASQHVTPSIVNALSDPGGYISRVGDVVVWNSDRGQEVIAGLQQVSESQIRIQSAITSIEATQLGLESTIGSLQNVAMATLGVTSLSGALMLWRLHALNKRFDGLEKRIGDIEDNLDAVNKAHLRTAVQKLREYDDTSAVAMAETARDEAQHAANVYGQLAYKEAMSKTPRMEVLNYRGRCYLLSLLTELRSRMVLGSLIEATTRFTEERPLIETLAKCTFKTAIGSAPEHFLSHAMKDQGVTLELLTELYRNAGRYDPTGTPMVRNADEMFELVRPKGIAGTGTRWWSFGVKPAVFANRLKFALACFEDIGRVEALHLIADQLSKAKSTIAELESRCKEWANQSNTGAFNGVVAYAFPQPVSTTS